MEIAAGHSILIADLPTNGLDSATALRQAQLGKAVFPQGGGLAHSVVASHQPVCAGLTGVWSVVQPSPELFALFDVVMVLSRCALILFAARTLTTPQWYVHLLGTPE